MTGTQRPRGGHWRGPGAAIHQVDTDGVGLEIGHALWAPVGVKGQALVPGVVLCSADGRRAVVSEHVVQLPNVVERDMAREVAEVADAHLDAHPVALGEACAAPEADEGLELPEGEEGFVLLVLLVVLVVLVGLLVLILRVVLQPVHDLATAGARGLAVGVNGRDEPAGQAGVVELVGAGQRRAARLGDLNLLEADGTAAHFVMEGWLVGGLGLAGAIDFIFYRVVKRASWLSASSIKTVGTIIVSTCTPTPHNTGSV